MIIHEMSRTDELTILVLTFYLSFAAAPPPPPPLSLCHWTKLMLTIYSLFFGIENINPHSLKQTYKNKTEKNNNQNFIHSNLHVYEYFFLSCGKPDTLY